MGIEDGFGLGQPLLQPGDLLLLALEFGGLWVGLRTALERGFAGQLTGGARPAPVPQERRVQPFAAQHGAQLTVAQLVGGLDDP